MPKISSETILKNVLKRIKPDDKTLKAKLTKSLNMFNTALKQSGVDAKAVVAGSIAKETFLKGDHDVDVFVRFNYDRYKDKDISKILKQALSKADIEAELVHGSRDYYQIKRLLNYELVPVLDITDPEKAVNVMDMSPLHVTWVKEKQKKLKKRFNDDIRIAKQFCKAQGVYGAESYIRGFSGHVLDILVIHYKGFMNLLKASQRWKDKEVIDPENIYKTESALKRLNKSKTDSPIIVIDPVLPSRNAAAALSYEKLQIFKEVAAEFLKNPSENIFIVKEKTLTEIKKEALGKKLVLLQVTPKKGKTDIVGAKLLKAFISIKNQIKFYDFDIVIAAWKWDKTSEKSAALFWYILESADILPITKRIGPPLNEKKHVADFKQKHPRTFTEKGRICAYVARKVTNVDKLVEHILKNDRQLKEKVVSVSVK